MEFLENQYLYSSIAWLLLFHFHGDNDDDNDWIGIDPASPEVAPSTTAREDFRRRETLGGLLVEQRKNRFWK